MIIIIIFIIIIIIIIIITIIIIIIITKREVTDSLTITAISEPLPTACYMCARYITGAGSAQMGV